MAALREAVTSPAQVVFATDTETAGGSLWKIGSEAVRVMGCYWEVSGYKWLVTRHIGGTVATTYSVSTTITEFFPESPNVSAGGPHTHPESDVTSLTADLSAKATVAHNHDASYAPTHSHPYESSGAVATHAGLADPHPTYLTGAEGNAAYAGTNDARLSDARTPLAHNHTEANVTNLTSDLAAKAPAAHNHDASYATTGHTHAGSQAFPVGALYLSVTATNPATSLGYGTWSQVAQGLLLIGQTGAQTGGQQVGNATHAHTFTQPSDHAALTHAGSAVGNHVFTQPSAHTDHPLLSHSAHAGATVGNHADVLNHVHLEQLQGGTTGTTTGTHLMGSAAVGGSLRSAGQSTLNPTAGGVAAQVHTVGQASAHTDHAAQSHTAHAGGAVDAHSVGQASQHGAQSHVGGTVAVGTTDPPSFVAYVWQRTA